MNIHICFSSSNEYSRHMGVAILSILAHAQEKDYYHFHVLDGGISEENRQKLASIVQGRGELHYIPVCADDFKDCPMTMYVDYITRQTYYRFRIPSYLPLVDKVLYLDCDIIVHHDVRELYELELGDAYLAGVPEVYQQVHTKRLEYRKDEWYCNAGVLLINNKKWRDDGIEEKLFSYVQKPEHPIVYLDQDVLNEVLKYSIHYLPLRWNLQHDAIFHADSYPWHEEQRVQAKAEPFIVHFTNPMKPWCIGCPNPWAYLYRNHLKASPWKNEYRKMRRLEIGRSICRAVWSYDYIPDGSLKKWRCLGIPVLTKKRTPHERKISVLGGLLWQSVVSVDRSSKEYRFLCVPLLIKKRPPHEPMISLLGGVWHSSCSVDRSVKKYKCLGIPLLTKRCSPHEPMISLLGGVWRRSCSADLSVKKYKCMGIPLLTKRRLPDGGTVKVLGVTVYRKNIDAHS